MKKTIYLLLISLSIFLGSSFTLKAQNIINPITSYRTELTWQLPDTIIAQTAYFSLIVDGEQFLTSIPNQTLVTSSYSLTITANNYFLIFDNSFQVGQHQWQLFGYNNEGDLVLQTDSQPFSIDPARHNFATISQQFTSVLDESGEMLLSIILMVGTSVLTLFFGIFFILNLILSTSAKKILTKVKGTNRLSTNRTGFIFDTKTNQGVPFALVTVRGRDKQGRDLTVTSVSDVNGIYNDISVPTGVYFLNVKKNGYSFPTLKTRPTIINRDDFYKGEEITINNDWSFINPMIPLDQIIPDLHKKHHAFRWRDRLWSWWQNLSKKQKYFELILLALSLLGIWFKPHPLFIVTTIIYGFLVLKRVCSIFRRANFVGTVVNHQNEKLNNVAVEVYQTDDEQNFHALVITDEHGKFSFRLNPGEYYLKARKNGYLGQNEGRTINVDEKITITKRRLTKTIQLLPIPQLVEDFFYQNDPPTPPSP
jgi:hypothetical protein